ncbi:MAG: class I SAM-dependent methyltransferase [Spirochaetaceae bacterium]|nr:class I SAM-dependent methyltransferase [Spirochaetaceae bacterium]
MDDLTHIFYNSRAVEVAKRYESVGGGLSELFPVLFRAGQSVLDIGAGSGRDMDRLHALGIEVWGLEPSDELRAEAIRYHPELKDRLVAGALPSDLGALSGRTFDAVLLSAVIMHIPDAELLDSAVAVRGLLKRTGKLVISTSTERDDVNPTTSRDAGGRLYRLRSADEVQLLFERLGFRLENRFGSEDVLQRPGVQWATLVFVYEGGA